MKKKTAKPGGLSKGWKAVIVTVAVVAALGIVFIGCYFGIPKFHDLINGVQQTAEAVIQM